MIEPRQIRAARALLNWNQDDLAKASGIARSSIKNIENDLTVARKETLLAITQSFENAGLEFIENSGVRFKRSGIEVLKGANSYLKLLDDIIQTVHEGDEVLFLMVDNALSTDAVKLKDKKLREKGIRFRHLISDKNPFCLYPVEEYRAIPDKYYINNTQAIYGNKVATMVYGINKMCLIVSNSTFAASSRNLFELVWNKYELPRTNKKTT